MPASDFVTWLSTYEETIGKVVGTMFVIGGIAWSRISSKRLPKSWALEEAKGPVAPTPIAPPDHERDGMARRVALAEERTEALTLRWKLSDVETRLREAIAEIQDKTATITHERAVNAELLRASRFKDLALEQLRVQVSQLQLALNHSEDVLDVVPVDDDWAERTPATTRKLK